MIKFFIFFIAWAIVSTTFMMIMYEVVNNGQTKTTLDRGAAMAEPGEINISEFFQ